MRLKGKVAVITGASSGIGKATAILFAHEGAKVVVNYSHSEKEANEVIDSIKKSGGEAFAFRADVSKEKEVKALIDSAVKRYGKLDIIYNNAGVELQKPVELTTEEEWDKVLGTNLKGAFLGAKYAIPEMIKNGKGSIISTASALGLVGSPNMAAYSASKGGIIALTKSLAIEHAPNIRVNCICPGAIDTPMLRRFINDSPNPEETEGALKAEDPMGRLGKPEEIAQVALFLASDDSSFVTGHALSADGGFVAQ